MRIRVKGWWSGDEGHRERADERRPVRLDARLRWDGADEAAAVTDLSDGGFAVQVAYAPPVGAWVELEVEGGFPRRAQVRWSLGQTCGGRFAEPATGAERADQRLALTLP